ncbi:ribosome recycling factor [Lebetimonas natsushimae]|uniref:Ribosome-recycling factor n=2 Tax=Lebetimonas natsushimae TaxID=1936991 RepID=A0A292YB06_9BACT|nr:ribosome recycling factor [Lebetimonas natsushimae]GAX86709.1 ribosome recycling factor [Lebetimonas natsushimae]
MEKVYEFAKDHMQKSIDVLKKDLNTLRTGKVSIHVLDGVKVEYYGTPTPLNQVANINAVDATTIVVQPWDKSIIKDIEKAIQEANVGANPNNDGDTIKMYFPPMTEEERKKQAKKAKEFAEKAKIAIRNVRREANDKIKKMFKDKEITEDDERRGLEKVQEITDNFIAKVDETVNKKIDEVMKV